MCFLRSAIAKNIIAALTSKKTGKEAHNRERTSEAAKAARSFKHRMAQIHCPLSPWAGKEGFAEVTEQLNKA